MSFFVRYVARPIHKRVRKPHFGAVDGAIAGSLDDGQQVVVFRVEDDALGGSLCRTRSECLVSTQSPPVRSYRERKSHLEAFERARHDASAIAAEGGGRGGIGFCVR
jgi:hypothetical protein